DMWEIYALEYLGESGHIAEKIVVNYNLWCKDENYRRKLSKMFGLPFADAGREVVPKAGDGSSFDLTSFDGRASEMKTLERWKHYEHDAWFREAFRGRDRLADIYRRIFPADPELDMFLKILDL